jgi:hypothetical protein
MKKRILFTCLAAAVLLNASCFLATSSTTVKGVVMNYGKPVEGAEVTFGPVGGEEKVITGPDGKFTLTARHRMASILHLKAKKAGLAQDEKIEFPGLAAPKDEVKIEMLQTVSYPSK